MVINFKTSLKYFLEKCNFPILTQELENTDHAKPKKKLNKFVFLLKAAKLSIFWGAFSVTI